MYRPKKDAPQNKHTISTHNLCRQIDNDSHVTQRPTSKEPLSITAKKKKENKRKSNNHSAIDQIAQAEAIKFATNQSGSRKITRETPKAHEQKLSAEKQNAARNQCMVLPTRISPFTHRQRQGGTGLDRGAHGIASER